MIYLGRKAAPKYHAAGAGQSLCRWECMELGMHPPLPTVPGTALLLSSHQLTQVVNG